MLFLHSWIYQTTARLQCRKNPSSMQPKLIMSHTWRINMPFCNVYSAINFDHKVFLYLGMQILTLRSLCQSSLFGNLTLRARTKLFGAVYGIDHLEINILVAAYVWKTLCFWSLNKPPSHLWKSLEKGLSTLPLHSFGNFLTISNTLFFCIMCTLPGIKRISKSIHMNSFFVPLLSFTGFRPPYFSCARITTSKLTLVFLCDTKISSKRSWTVCWWVFSH